MAARSSSQGAREGVAARARSSALVAANGPEAPSLVQLVEQQTKQVERALPQHLKQNAEAYTRALVTVIRQTPKLAKCYPPTVLGGLMVASQLGLEFGPLGHAYLVPFYNSKTRRDEAQFVFGYKGVIDLAWRSGQLRSIIARTVRRADVFDFAYGLEDRLEHVPTLSEESPSYAWYAVAKFEHGGHAFVVLGRADADRHRMASKTGAKNEGPWRDHYDQMAMKSAVIELKPFLPLTTEVARQLEFDGVVATGDDPDNLDIAEPDWIDVDPVDDQPAPNLGEPLPVDGDGQAPVESFFPGAEVQP